MLSRLANARHARPLAALAAFALVACLGMPSAPAWAEGAMGGWGDASEEGAVIQRGDSGAAADSASQVDESQTEKENADDSTQETRGTQGENASDGEEAAADEESSITPLDAEGNVINEGQVSDSSFLYDAAIADLAGADSYYDGQRVQITGEAVGEAIVPLRSLGRESSMVRVTLYEASSGASITVCMTASDAAKIKTYGAYGKTGSILRVDGVFNLTCHEHEGESDIHAETVTVVSQGSVSPDEFDVKAFIPGLAALAVGLVLIVVFWRLKERSR